MDPQLLKSDDRSLCFSLADDLDDAVDHAGRLVLVHQSREPRDHLVGDPVLPGNVDQAIQILWRALNLCP